MTNKKQTDIDQFKKDVELQAQKTLVKSQKTIERLERINKRADRAEAQLNINQDDKK